MLKRNRKVTFRLNEGEWRQLKGHVQKSGLSQEAYLRLLISGQRPKELPPIEYHALLRQLYAIGVNMNQIAARANSTGFFLRRNTMKTQTHCARLFWRYKRLLPYRRLNKPWL